jgi:hypothetical protein
MHAEIRSAESHKPFPQLTLICICIFQVQAIASMMELFLTRAKDPLFESILSDTAAILRSLVEQVRQDLPTGNLTPPPGPDNMGGGGAAPFS